MIVWLRERVFWLRQRRAQSYKDLYYMVYGGRHEGDKGLLREERWAWEIASMWKSSSDIWRKRVDELSSPHKLEHSEETLSGVHSRYACLGQFCTIHRMSDHHMRSFPQHWRSDRGFMERICPHGVGHPDPDEVSLKTEYDKVHGCDGCCSKNDVSQEEKQGDLGNGVEK